MPTPTRTWPGTTGRVLVLQHHDDIPAGYVGDCLAQRGARLDIVHASHPKRPDPRHYDLVVTLGSYDSAYDDSLPYVRAERDTLAAAVESDVPILGICFGAQLLSRVLGGAVRRSPQGPEIGWLHVHNGRASSPSPPPQPRAPEADTITPGPWLVWHHDELSTPPGAAELARTPAAVQAFRHGPHLGLQFHPEAKIENIRLWAARDVAGLRHNGIARTDILAESADIADAARRRAYALTDAAIAGCLTTEERVGGADEQPAPHADGGPQYESANDPRGDGGHSPSV